MGSNNLAIWGKLLPLPPLCCDHYNLQAAGTYLFHCSSGNSSFVATKHSHKTSKALEQEKTTKIQNSNLSS